MADIHTGTVKTDEFSMDYLKFGRGERTLVILPGLSVQRVMLSANAVANAYKQLTEDFTVYLFERRNELPGIYSVYDMARDTIKAIEALGLERFSLLGASQGGMIAMVIASEKPMLVEKMILASTSAAVTDRQYEALFDGWIRLAEAGDKQGLYLATDSHCPIFRQISTLTTPFTSIILPSLFGTVLFAHTRSTLRDNRFHRRRWDNYPTRTAAAKTARFMRIPTQGQNAPEFHRQGQHLF